MTIWMVLADQEIEQIMIGIPLLVDWYTSIGVTIAYRIGESSSSYIQDDAPVDYLEEGNEYYEEDDNN